MNQIQYNELLDVVEVFEDCYVDNREVTCFKDIKRIIDERVNIELLNEVEKAEICTQLMESLELFQELNISTNIIDIILLSVIKSFF